MQHDARGLVVTIWNDSALEPFERAIRAFQTYRGDPLAALDEALSRDPDFAAAAATKALVLMTLFERRFADDALAVLDRHATALARATPREQALGAAAALMARGQWQAGARELEAILVEHPRDAVALQVAHLIDFVRGDALNLRNRLSRVLPHWSREIPGYAYVLGMHAFGLEECNQYPQAEEAGRRALEIARDDCWAVHAVAHVMEMQGRVDEGMAWLEDRRADWATPDNGFAYHNAWHLALFHLDRDDHAAALAIHDEVLAGATELALTRVDGTALLWRLRLQGAEMGDRFVPIADAWESALDREGGFYAFNDFHAALAFAAAGRQAPLERLRARLREAALSSADNGTMTREVGLEACEAAVDFAAGRFGAAARRLASVRDGASRFGGSHAQRDLLTLMLVEAATRAGEGRLAAHYVAERLVHKPGSALGHRLLARTQSNERKAA